MSAQLYAAAATLPGTEVPKVWNQPDSSRSRPLAYGGGWFGDLVIVTFLLAQCFDGIFTYVGVQTFGLGIEANPILTGLMASFGCGPALAGAKIVAGGLGICLHLRQIHMAVALLSIFYLTAAIVPWSMILFF
jgi:hypothetical protein